MGTDIPGTRFAVETFIAYPPRRYTHFLEQVSIFSLYDNDELSERALTQPRRRTPAKLKLVGTMIGRH
jgi:hypothetical protein